MVNGLLCKLNKEGFYAQGYADDYLDPLMGLARTASRQVELWYDASGLTVNPEKQETELDGASGSAMQKVRYDLVAMSKGL